MDPLAEAKRKTSILVGSQPKMAATIVNMGCKCPSRHNQNVRHW